MFLSEYPHWIYWIQRQIKFSFLDSYTCLNQMFHVILAGDDKPRILLVPGTQNIPNETPMLSSIFDPKILMTQKPRCMPSWSQEISRRFHFSSADIFAVQKGVSLPPTSGNKIPQNLEAWGIFPRDDIPKITWKKHGWFFTKPFEKYDRQNAKWFDLPPRFGVTNSKHIWVASTHLEPHAMTSIFEGQSPKNKAFSKKKGSSKGSRLDKGYSWQVSTHLSGDQAA